MSNRFDSARVYNRTDKQVSVVFDGVEEIWGPHEERTLTVAIARHCIYHSTVQYDQFTDNRVTQLVMLKKDEPLPADLTGTFDTSVPFSAMEPKYATDGTLLTPKVLDISERSMRLRGRGIETTIDGKPLGSDPARTAAEAKFADDIIDAIAESNDTPGVA